MKAENLTKAQRWALADKLAEDRLPLVNAALEEVVPADNFYARYGKRALDIVISGVALIVTLPINAVIAGVTAATLGSPLFFKQKRVG